VAAVSTTTTDLAAATGPSRSVALPELLHPNQLAALRESPWLRQSLKSQRLCAQIKSIDEAEPSERQAALRRVRAANPEFDQFVCKLLSENSDALSTAVAGLKRKALEELAALPPVNDEDEEEEEEEEDEEKDEDEEGEEAEDEEEEDEEEEEGEEREREREKEAGAEQSEFSFLQGTIAEHDLGTLLPHPPQVERLQSVDAGSGVKMSALRWVIPAAAGHARPLVLLHGTAMNAHTFDTLLLYLASSSASASSSSSSERVVLCVDLVGHGRSDHLPQGLRYSPQLMARLLSSALAAWLPAEGGCSIDLAGMSLGGLVAICLAAAAARGESPHRLSSLTLFDMTPGAASSGTPGAVAIRGFISSGPTQWPFEEAVQRAVELSGGRRSEQSLRVGVWHNARRDGATGLWQWRYDARVADEVLSPANVTTATSEELWAEFDAIPSSLPILLLHGAASQVVSAEHVAELLKRRSGARAEVIRGGHSLHSDAPGETARILVQQVLER